MRELAIAAVGAMILIGLGLATLNTDDRLRADVSSSAVDQDSTPASMAVLGFAD